MKKSYGVKKGTMKRKLEAEGSDGGVKGVRGKKSWQ